MQNLSWNYSLCVCFEGSLVQCLETWTVRIIAQTVLGHYLSPTHRFLFLMSLCLCSTSFVMEEAIAEVLATILMHDSRWCVGVVAACGFFLEWRTSLGHLNESVTIQMQAVFTCAWPFVLSAKGTLHRRAEDGSTCSCGCRQVSSFHSLILSLCMMYIFLFCFCAKASFASVRSFLKSFSTIQSLFYFTILETFT